jgi:hypothetical protein
MFNVDLKNFDSDTLSKIKGYRDELLDKIAAAFAIGKYKVENPKKKILNFGCYKTHFGHVNADVMQRQVENFLLIPEKPPYRFWPDQSFGLVVAMDVLEHCEDPVAVRKELNRIGETLILITPKTTSLFYKAKYHKWLFPEGPMGEPILNPEYEEDSWKKMEDQQVKEISQMFLNQLFDMASKNAVSVYGGQ